MHLLLKRSMSISGQTFPNIMCSLSKQTTYGNIKCDLISFMFVEHILLCRKHQDRSKRKLNTRYPGIMSQRDEMST